MEDKNTQRAQTSWALDSGAGPRERGKKGHLCVCFFKGGDFSDTFLQHIKFCLKLHTEHGVPDAFDYAPHQAQQVFGNVAFCLQLPPFME